MSDRAEADTSQAAPHDATLRERETALTSMGSTSSRKAELAEERLVASIPSSPVPSGHSATPAPRLTLPPPVYGASPASIPHLPLPDPHLQYLDTLVAAATAMSATLDPDKVAEVLVRRTHELLGVDGVAALWLENGRVQVLASHGLSPAFVQNEVAPLEQSVAGRALAEGRTFATWDVRSSPDTRLAEAAKQEGIVSVAVAPMFFAGKAVGTLNVYCRATQCFSSHQFQLLSLLGATGATALANARSYQALQTQSAEVRAGFLRVGEALSASLDIGETLRLIVQLSVDMTGANAGAVFLLQDATEGGNLRLAGMRGLERRSVRRFRIASVSPIMQEAMETRRVVTIPDTTKVHDVPFPTLRLSMRETAPALSMVCVPLIIKNEVVGVLEQYATNTGHFDSSDVQLLHSFAHQACIAIENARLYAQERGVAQTLQRAFLPEVAPHITGFDIGRIYAPGNEAATVGGDTYDIFALDNGRMAAVIADVSGSGTLAATLAVMAKYTIRAYALENPDPSSVMTRVNEALCRQITDSMFLTVVYAVLDPQNGTVSLASAGHPASLLWRRGATECQAVGTNAGMIAGLFRDQEYLTETVAVSCGDVLVFYTDGVTEARKHKVMFGQERLSRVIADNAHRTAPEIAGEIYASVTDWGAGSRLDDIALLVLKGQ